MLHEKKLRWEVNGLQRRGRGSSHDAEDGGDAVDSGLR